MVCLRSRKAYAQIVDVIENSPELDGREVTQDSPMWSLFMGMAHEAIHLETSSVLMREMPLSLFQKHPLWPDVHPSAPKRDADTVHPPVVCSFFLFLLPFSSIFLVCIRCLFLTLLNNYK